MAQFSIPAAEPKYSATIEYFRGIDLLNSPSNVDESRSPAAPNMIRDQVGKVRKRMGYTTRATAPNGGRINGVHFLNGERLIHPGTKLYKLAGTEWTELADAPRAFPSTENSIFWTEIPTGCTTAQRSRR